MRFGVDEAGKGPVLGSMFAAAVVCEPTVLPDDVGDSKDIAPERRGELAAEIRAVADVGVAEIPVARIDDPATDMNGLTVAAHAAALSAVVDADGSIDGLAGTVDAGDVDADRFGRRVADAVDAEVTVDAAHGADARDPLVGAASIVAKEAREAHVDALGEEYDTHGPIGSGYPSDPTTKEFLEAYVDATGELPACARRTWATCDEVLAAAEQAALGEF